MDFCVIPFKPSPDCAWAFGTKYRVFAAKEQTVQDAMMCGDWKSLERWDVTELVDVEILKHPDGNIETRLSLRIESVELSQQIKDEIEEENSRVTL